MSTAIIFLACVPAYLTASIALLLGAGWGTAFLVLLATGVAAALILGLLAAAARSGARQAITPAGNLGRTV